MVPLYQRSFQVNYFEKDEKTWIIESHLTDTEHDIMVTLDVSVPEMVIEDAQIKFIRHPLEECLMIEEKTAQLKGVNILKDYRSKILPLFMGPEGCPNIMTLLGVSTPGFPYFYYPHQVRIGQMEPEEWWSMVRTQFADDCLAHKLYNQK